MKKKINLKKIVKSSSILKVSFYFFDAFSNQLKYNLVKFLFTLNWFLKDYVKFKLVNANKHSNLSIANLIPQLADKTSNNPLDHIYVLQNAWACQKLFENKPKAHVDIGSSVSAIAIMSQFTPTTAVDIRTIDIELKNLNFVKGTILNLPFKNSSVESITSICVIEHIGLGRYGDPIDPYGSEKSMAELQRVAKKNGSIILSVPVGKVSRVMFNAHREFVPSYFIRLMNSCELIEKKFIVGNRIKNTFSKNDDNVVGLFYFKKI